MWCLQRFAAGLAFFALAGSSVPGLSEESAPSDGPLLSNVRQLTFAGRRAGEGYFSRDGSKIIFQSERDPDNPFFQIYTMDLNSGATHRVSPGIGKTTCAWFHPDGHRILFSSTHLDPQAADKQRKTLEERASGKSRRYAWDYDEHYDIFTADLDGRDLQNLTGARGYDAEGAWSPDGKLVVFASNRHAYESDLPDEDREIFARDKSYLMDIYSMNADGTNVRRLTRTRGYDGGPFFSADGKKIVWRRFSTDGRTAEIFIMNADGTDQRQVTRLGAMSWAPFFHPSGDYVVFATNVNGYKNIELYVVDAEGSREPVRVTMTDGFDGLPSFTPDGRTLAWTSNRTAEKQSQLFLADWDDGAARRLLGLPPVQTQELAARERVTGRGRESWEGPAPAIRAKELRAHVERLASETMQGRLTGTEGERRATQYVASVFASLGLVPAGDQGTFFQEFGFTAGASLGEKNALTVRFENGEGQASYAVDVDWRPLAFSRIGPIKAAPVVFAGYGIVAPPGDDLPGYDSFVHLDLKDNWVLVFRGLPQDVSAERRQHLARYASLRHKAMVVRDRGALGLIVVSGPNAKVKDPLVRLTFDASMAATSIAALSITDRVAERLLRPSGKNLRELQNVLDRGELVQGFVSGKLRLEAVIDIRQEKRTGRNVLARLSSGHQKAPQLVVGAHVDHLGKGGGGNSLARDEERQQIHPGANDNASGVAALLEIARYLAQLQGRGELELERDVIFAAWSGEELGLLGSHYFVENLAKTAQGDNLRERVNAYLNMDMVGGLQKNLVLQGLGSSTSWQARIERANAPVGLPIVTQGDAYLPTDATSFYLKGVPVLSAFTGAHPEYHTPRDTADTLNYEGGEKIARFMARLAIELATSESVPDYVALEKPSGGLNRGTLRTYLGTIPDYAQRGETGVKLAGVAKGGPADRAGLKADDVIRELAGKAIENLYDYTYAIEALKVGVPVTIVVDRQGQRLPLSITPESRE